MKRKIHAPETCRGRQADSFGNISESRELLGRALSKRSLLCVVDDRSFKSERYMLKSVVFRDADASGDSRVIPYSEFYNGRLPPADVLLLRSSRIFAHRLPQLKGVLGDFRRENPKSAVLLCVFGEHEVNAALGLAEQGLVNVVYDDPPNDFALLHKAATVLERLASD